MAKAGINNVSYINLLLTADVMGRPGRRLLAALVPQLRKHYDLHGVFINGENVAHGFGMGLKQYKELCDAGIDGFSMGNHVWDQRELIEFIDQVPNIVRPANFPPGTPGKGAVLINCQNSAGQVASVGMINIMGRVFMQALDCPFQTVDREVGTLKAETPVIWVDVHAEASSEKQAMGWYLAGQVTAVTGSHSHVQTADERILPGGTAFITDIGLTGPMDGVIGMEKEGALYRMVKQMPARLNVLETGAVQFCGLLLEVDVQTGKTIALERLQYRFETIEEAESNCLFPG
jgi:metallophosphoesterase (TIGR00282 family)